MKKTINELRAALKSSIVEFTFTKLNGEVREAKGTINPDLIPKEYQSKATTSKSSGDALSYFDLGVNGFRRVSADAEISF